GADGEPRDLSAIRGQEVDMAAAADRDLAAVWRPRRYAGWTRGALDQKARGASGQVRDPHDIWHRVREVHAVGRPRDARNRWQWWHVEPRGRGLAADVDHLVRNARPGHHDDPVVVVGGHQVEV